MRPSSLVRPGLLILAGLLAALPLQAALGGFSATLATEEKSATGLTALTPEENTVLDRLVADDLARARRENLTGLDGTFVARLSEASRHSAGLDRLTPEQLARLNALVASALAARPTPKERPRLKDSDVFVKNRPEIHGSVTVAYGWGAGGRDYRAGSLWLDYYDPATRLGLTVGINSVSGDGFRGGYYPDYYYPGYDYGPVYSRYDPIGYYPAPSGTFIGASYRGDNFGAGISFADSSCFRPSPGGFGGRRR